MATIARSCPIVSSFPNAPTMAKAVIPDRFWRRCSMKESKAVLKRGVFNGSGQLQIGAIATLFFFLGIGEGEGIGEGMLPFGCKHSVSVVIGWLSTRKLLGQRFLADFLPPRLDFLRHSFCFSASFISPFENRICESGDTIKRGRRGSRISPFAFFQSSRDAPSSEAMNSSSLGIEHVSWN